MTPKLAIPDTAVLPRSTENASHGLAGLHDLALVDHLRHEAQSRVLRTNWERRVTR